MYQPNYSINNHIVQNLTKIAEMKALIETSKVVPKQETILKRKAAVRMAASSTAIEGNILNENEVEKLFEGEHTYGPKKDEKEVQNYKKGIEFVGSILEDNVKLDLQLIRKIHKILMEDLLPREKLGHFRKGPVYVVDMGESEKEDKLLYTAPPWKDVSEHLEDLLEWVKKSRSENLNPVLIASLFHYQYVTIHPFTDGNGRTARLLTTYLLYQNDYEIEKIYALDSYYNKNREGYYKELDVGKDFESRKDADLTSWVEYFTDGFVWELERIKEQIQLIKVQTNQDKAETIYLDQDEMRMLDFLSTMGRMTSKDVAEILKVSQRSAQMKIKKLLENNIIEKKGKGPASYYILKE